ncbi:MAG: cytochrome P450, partial [Nitrososphaerales archaeon]
LRKCAENNEAARVGILFNPFAPEVRQNPYPYYKRLRQDSPVAETAQRGIRVVSRYDDVVSMLGRPDLFSSSIMLRADAALLGTDPPAHTRTRRIVNRAFTAQQVASLEGDIRAIADGMVRRISSLGEFDLMSELAVPLPMIVIAEILGIETGKLEEFKRWSEAVVVNATGTSGSLPRSQIQSSLREFEAFFDGMIGERKATPGEDLVSALLSSETPEDALDSRQVLDVCKLLLIAGNETTTNLIGNAVLALLRNQGELDKVTANPALVPALVEETLRYDAPVQFLNRITTQEAELSGVSIPARAVVMSIIGSANRDERKFEDPDRFDVARNPRDHLAFGHGAHFCLGAPLARLEARTSLQALLPLLPRLRAADNQLERVELVDSTQLRGPKRLRLAVKEAQH